VGLLSTVHSRLIVTECEACDFAVSSCEDVYCGCHPLLPLISFENDSRGMLVLRILLLVLAWDLFPALEYPFRVLRAAARLTIRDLNAGRQPTITAIDVFPVSSKRRGID
jgi:hypothetical protein